MKKALSLLFALLFVLALFSGCGQGSANPTPQPQNTTAPGTSETAVPTEEVNTGADNTKPGPLDHLANGNFPKDEHGFALETYNYEGPLTTSDEVFTFWTVTYMPQLVPEEGFNNTSLPKVEREATGVQMEYQLIPSESRRENYAVLLASDDLCDLMTGTISFHPGTIEDGIEDGFYINIHDYMDYCPNYIYEVTHDRKNDTNTYATIFRGPDVIAAFYTLSKNSHLSTNYLARRDWLEKCGLTNDDVNTFDDLHDMLMAFKVNIDTCDYPWSMLSTIDARGYYTFTAYDTLPAVSGTALGPMYVIDGTVYFSHSTDRDREFMTMINSWYNDGIIDPNWAGYSSVADTKSRAVNSEVGYMMMNIQEIPDYEQAIPSDSDEPSWVPIKRPVRYEGQTFHCGGERSRLGTGTVSVNAKSSDIPLLVSWCDWRYSPKGSEISSFGEEGVLWNWDENGKRVATEFAFSNPAGYGFGWITLFYAFNALSEHGMGDNAVMDLQPGWDKMKDIVAYWDQWDYDGAYEYPAGAKLNQEQSEKVDQYKNDVATYIAENYLAFVDNSKPLSEWDSYVNGLMQHNFPEVVALYQEAYDNFQATMVY